MSGLLVGFGLLAILSWAMMLIVWRRNIAIQRKLVEPSLVSNEFVRLLATAHAAAKLMLDTCPESDKPGPCTEQRRRLDQAVAAVDEFRS
jgi:hypothetical protein